MADNRKIVHGVRMADGKVVTDVDELAKVLTPEMQNRLEAAGSISGDWKQPKTAKAEKAEKTEKTEKQKAPKPKE